MNEEAAFYILSAVAVMGAGVGVWGRHPVRGAGGGNQWPIERVWASYGVWSSL